MSCRCLYQHEHRARSPAHRRGGHERRLPGSPPLRSHLELFGEPVGLLGTGWRCRTSCQHDAGCCSMRRWVGGLFHCLPPPPQEPGSQRCRRRARSILPPRLHTPFCGWHSAAVFQPRKHHGVWPLLPSRLSCPGRVNLHTHACCCSSLHRARTHERVCPCCPAWACCLNG